MPYIGNTIRAADDYRLIDDISSGFNGSTTSFALQVAGSTPVPFPKSPQQVLISVNGVIQEPDPTGSSGFNLVGTNIVFSSAPTNGHAFFGIIYATADYLNAGGNFPSGSLGAPSFTFIGDENTGLYRKSGGSVGFVSDATEIANFDSNGITISSGNLILGDSSGANDDRIKLGASGDLEIYHDGSNSKIVDSGTGSLIIQTSNFNLDNAAGNENILTATENGAVELYFDNAKKAETVTGGFTVTGVCTATSFAGDGSSLSGINTDLVSDTSPQLGGDLDTNSFEINLDDAHAVNFGDSQDAEIKHTGSNFVIRNTEGNIRIEPKNGELGIQLTPDGSTSLYYDNSKKFETTSYGALLSDGKFIIDDGSTGHAFFDLNSEGLQIASGTTGFGAYKKIEYNASVHNFFRQGSLRVQITNGGIQPATDNTADLGTSALRWRNIYTNDLKLSNEGSSNDVDGTWGSYTIQEGHEDLYLINHRTGKKFKFNLTEVA